MEIKMRFKNCFAFGDSWCSFDFTKKGLYSITGKHLSSSSKSTNGVGKTSIINTLNFGLYGETPKSFMKSDIVNLNTGKNCIVEVDINIKGVEGFIARGINCDILQYNNIEVCGDFLLFFKNGKDCRRSSMSETQEEITRFIGVDFESFTTAVVFASAQESFSSKTSANQDRIFSTLLNLGIFDEARDRVKLRLKEYNSQKDSLEHDLSTLRGEHKRLQLEVDRSLSYREEWERTVKTNLFEVKNKIAQIESKETYLQEQFDELIQNYEKQKEDYEILCDSDVEELKNELQELKSSSKELTDSLQKKKVVSAIALKDKRNAENTIISVRNLEEGVICDSCGNNITTESKSRYLNKLLKDVETATKTSEEVNKEIADLSNKLSSAERSMNSIVEKIDKIDSSKRVLNRLEFEITTMKDKIEDLKPLKIEATGLADKLTKDLQNPPEATNVNARLEEINILNSKIDSINEQLSVIDYNIELFNFWHIGFGPSGVRNYLVRSTIPKLNSFANRFSRVLTNGELDIIFQTQVEVGSKNKKETRNKFSVVAVDEFGSDKYVTSSGGESRRVDICVNLALHYLLAERVGIPFCFFDEMYLSLDNKGKEKVTELLREVTGDIPSVFVISNQEDVMYDMFDGNIIVTRKDKASFVEF